MNLPLKHAIKYEHNEEKLKRACDFVRNFRNRIIVVEGSVGSGKSTIIEALVDNHENIFRGCGDNTHNGPFVLGPSDSEYIAMDETEYFKPEQVLDFVKFAESEGKIALISSQGLWYSPEILKRLFYADNVSVVTI